MVALGRAHCLSGAGLRPEIGMPKEAKHRVALCCCTRLAFACNILLFQKQKFLCFQQNVPWPCKTGNNIWLKETMRILDKFLVSCWYIPFSQACRELGSLQEKFALWTLFLSALGVAVHCRWWQVAPDPLRQTPKKQRGFCP